MTRADLLRTTRGELVASPQMAQNNEYLLSSVFVLLMLIFVERRWLLIFDNAGKISRPKYMNALELQPADITHRA